MTDSEKVQVYDYLAAFISSDILYDLNAEISGEKIDGLSVISNEIDSISVALKDYGVSADLDVSGDFTFTFDDSNRYSIESSAAVFKDDLIFEHFDISGEYDAANDITDGKIAEITNTKLPFFDSGSIKLDSKQKIDVKALFDFPSLPLADYQTFKEIYLRVNALLYEKSEAVTNGNVDDITYVYTPYLAGDGSVLNWIISFSNGGKHKISFTLFSNSSDTFVNYDGNIYLAKTAGIIASESTPGSNIKPFTWDISVKTAKRTDADYDNWNYVTKDITISDGNIYNLEIEEADMKVIRPSISYEEGKWFALLIGTGEADLSKLECNGADIVSSEGTFTDYNGKPKEDDEFVLWFNAADLEDSEYGYKTFEKELIFSRDEAVENKITLRFIDTDKVVFNGYLFEKDQYQLELEDGTIIYRGEDEDGNVPEPVYP